MYNHSPHASTVEVNQEPLRRVEGEALSELTARHVVAELRADESRSCVRCVDVHPDVFLFAWKRGQNKGKSLPFRLEKG